jgi:hypothetical protein
MTILLFCYFYGISGNSNVLAVELLFNTPLFHYL